MNATLDKMNALFAPEHKPPYIGDCGSKKFSRSVLYCPDGLDFAAIPYIKAYLDCPIATTLKEAKEYNTILYSWAFAWQDMEWTKKLGEDKKRVVVGGSCVKYLKEINKLPDYPVTYYLDDIDCPEHKQTRIMPDFSVFLSCRPFAMSLPVYSGNGCNWSKCTFCRWPKEKYIQFDPGYIAQVVLLANSFQKLAGLSTPVHTVAWLCDLEKFLPSGRRYWAYTSAKDKDWFKLTKIKETFIGSEYLSNSVLKRIKKGISAEKIIDSILEILASGIDVYSNIIEDLYETTEELQEHQKNKIYLLKQASSKQTPSHGKLWLSSCNLITYQK